ncbi:MAG: malate synthase A, partial [Anaerolineae bacterium]|nr:malate synthase A [Anaerolineae bacterium]
EEFDKYMPTPNQIFRKREDVNVTTTDLLTVPEGTITEEGLRVNIDVGILYMSAWLDGNGCVPIYNLMEDAATAEISRSQLWQWVNNDNARLTDGRSVDKDLYREIAPQVLADIKARVGEEAYNQGKYELAAQLFEQLITDDNYADFLTLKAYDYLN